MLIINKYWERTENKENKKVERIKEVEKIEKVEKIKEIKHDPIFTEIYEILDRMESRINE
jgi:hypothetical protein